MANYPDLIQTVLKEILADEKPKKPKKPVDSWMVKKITRDRTSFTGVIIERDYVGVFTDRDQARAVADSLDHEDMWTMVRGIVVKLPLYTD